MDIKEKIYPFAQMWHKVVWMRHPMRLELTHEGLLISLANHYVIRGAQPISI